MNVLWMCLSLLYNFNLIPVVNLLDLPIPTQRDCWYLIHDGGKLSYSVINILHRSARPVIIYHPTYDNDELIHYRCSAFLFIYQSAHLIYSVFSENSIYINSSGAIDSKDQILVLCDGCEITQIDRDVVEIINKYMLNVLFVYINKPTKLSVAMIDQDDGNRKPLKVYSPVSNTTHDFGNMTVFNMTLMLENLFQMQRRHARDRNTLRMSLFNCPPFVTYEKDGSIDGIEYRIIREIARNLRMEVLKANYTVDPWAAVREDVLSGRADVGMCSIWLTDETSKHFDLTVQISTVCVTFLVPKPAPINPSKYLYLSLGGNVWLCFLASMTLITIALCGVANLMTRPWSARQPHSPFQDLAYCLLTILDIATLHGSDVSPRQFSLRSILMSWMLCCLLVTTVYTTGYSSFLTQQKYSKRLRILEDTIDTDVYWGSKTAFMNAAWAEELTSSYHDYLHELAKRGRIETDSDDRMRRIRSRRYAIFVKRLDNSYIMDIEDDKEISSYLHCVDDCVSQYFTVFALRKRSPFVSIMNRRILQLAEAGIMKHWFDDIIHKLNQSYMLRYFIAFDGSKIIPRPLLLFDLRAVFMFIGVGWIISGGVFLCEVVWSKFVCSKMCTIGIIRRAV